MIAEITEAYLDAGSDIVSTNTFNANRVSQADYGAEHLVRDLNMAAAHIARDAADTAEAKDGRPRFVAGAIGPTNKTLSLSPDVNDPGYRAIDFDELKDVYREQIDALLDGGVDFILIETIFDTLNAKAGIMAVLEAGEARGDGDADDDLDDRHRHVRPQPVRPFGRGVLGGDPPCQAADGGAQLLVRRAAAAAACAWRCRRSPIR